MEKKTVSTLLLTLLLLGTLTWAFNIQPVKASGTIYIRPDGTVEGTDKIQRDGDVYTFTGNIFDEIVVQRDNILIDGAGNILQGTGSGRGIFLFHRDNVTIKNAEINSFGHGILLTGSSNNIISGNKIIANSDRGVALAGSSNNIVSGNDIANDRYGITLSVSSNNTISCNNVANNMFGVCLTTSSSHNTISDNAITEHTRSGVSLGEASEYNNISGNIISACMHGIHLWHVSHNTISGSFLTNNQVGIHLEHFSTNNIITENNITANNEFGIGLFSSSSNEISGNNMTSNNWYGIELWASSSNLISGNNIANSWFGIWLNGSTNNNIYHNNFVNNTWQVYFCESGYTNFWDDSYPSGGNYWSDYPGVDEKSGRQQRKPGSDGIGDTPYIIDESNQDDYPLVKPWSSRPVPTEAIGKLIGTVDESLFIYS